MAHFWSSMQSSPHFVKEADMVAVLKKEDCGLSFSPVPRDRHPVSNRLWCHIWESYSPSPLSYPRALPQCQDTLRQMLVVLAFAEILGRNDQFTITAMTK